MSGDRRGAGVTGLVGRDGVEDALGDDDVLTVLKRLQSIDGFVDVDVLLGVGELRALPLITSAGWPPYPTAPPPSHPVVREIV